MDWTFVSCKVESQFVNHLPMYLKFGAPLFCLNLLNCKICLFVFFSVPSSSPLKPSFSSAYTFVARYILFETRTGDEKDDNNSLQRFGVLHLLQREE